MRISRTITAALAAVLAAALTMPVAAYAVDIDDAVASWWKGSATGVVEFATTNDSFSRCSLIMFDKAVPVSALFYVRLSNTGSLAILLATDYPMLPGPMILKFRGAPGFNLTMTQRADDGRGVSFMFQDAHIAKFITSFGTASSMTVEVPGQPEFVFDLTGSRAAYGALTNCTAKVAEEDASRKIRR